MLIVHLKQVECLEFKLPFKEQIPSDYSFPKSSVSTEDLSPRAENNGHPSNLRDHHLPTRGLPAPASGMTCSLLYLPTDTL